MKKVLSLCFALSLLLAGMASCESDDFSSSPSDRLSFSKDTVSFDTVFTGQASADQRFMIYNPNKKALRIQTLYLADPDHSGFIINVDGQSSNRINDLEIDAKDSLFVFVRINPSGSGQNSPQLFKDSIVFITNGVMQHVKLRAYGQDATRWSGKLITADTTLSGTRPFLISDSLYVAPGVTLTLAAGTTLHFHNGASLKVDGTLVSNGTAASPVVLRGDRIDNLFDDLPYDYLAGQWEGVHLTAASTGNSLTHTIIRGGNYGILADSSDVSALKLEMHNSTIHNVRGHGLQATNCRVEAENSLFTNARYACLSLLGGSYRFLHCTIANYYIWDLREGSSVNIRNYTGSSKENLVYYPVTNTTFTNCIIYGSRYPELLLTHTFNKEEVATSFECFFHASLIRSKEQTDNRFTDILWSEDPVFRATGKEDYIYDFHLDSLSAAIGKADPNFSSLLPQDADGVNRMSDGTPDMGAYEFVPALKEQN
ncbi:MAG: right-handed parallel beta-helix repeat-containing protein [Bacteroidales bacterium]|nr:right-handed parallel beta-helix repeat-containing protein [Bacteroidales bacterium]